MTRLTLDVLKRAGNSGLLVLLPLLVPAAHLPAVLAAESATQPAATASQPLPIAEVVAHATISPWQPVFQGIELCEASTARPRPLQIRAARIDLKEPSIRFFVTPSNGDKPGEVNARRSTEFLEEFKCQLAINGSFFAGAFKPAEPQDIIGLSVSNGDAYSEPNHFAALLISKDNKARVQRPPFDLTKIYNAVAGDTLLLEDGQIAPEATDPNSKIAQDLHPRSAAGISKNGRYLILMTVDGRQQGYSEGTSKPETAEWLLKLGAWDGINLDGGGSTNLAIEGTGGKAELVNKPGSAWLRYCANHLGVYAKPLRKKLRKAG